MCIPLGQKKQLGITGFGISVTTMEEVFMKVADSGVDETTLISSNSHIKEVQESTPLVDNVTKTIGMHIYHEQQ